MPTITEYVEVALVCMQIEYGFFQTLNTSVCRSGKSKSWQCGGCTLAEVRRQSSLERMTACFSFDQSILNLATAWVTTSSSSSNAADWGSCSVETPAYIQPLWVRCRQHEFMSSSFWSEEFTERALRSKMGPPSQWRVWEIGCFHLSQTLPPPTQSAILMTWDAGSSHP